MGFELWMINDEWWIKDNYKFSLRKPKSEALGL